jgi:putative phosphoesterase
MNGQKLLVLSDIHGAVPALTGVLNWAKGCAVGAAVFLGDGIEEMSAAAAGFPFAVKMVRGNCDRAVSAPIPEAALLDFAGHRFFLCHGHRYSPSGSLSTLVAAARNNEADAALFGHTHVPFCETVDGLLLINPGSVGRPRSNAGATFAVIECLPETALKASFWNIAPAIGIVPLPSVVY